MATDKAESELDRDYLKQFSESQEPASTAVVVAVIQGTLNVFDRHKARIAILLPLIVPQKMKFDDFAKTTAFWQVASTITALSTQDERIAEEFRAIEKGRISGGKIAFG